MRNFTLRIFLFFAVLINYSANTFSQVSIANGSTYTQNFDAIGSSGTATLPLGWRADVNSGNFTVGTYSSAGTSTDNRAAADMNASNKSGIYNFGAGTTTQGNGDRAVGGITGGTTDKSINIYLDLQNSGSTAITDLNVTYAIEKYRNGSNSDGYSVRLYYSTTGAAGSWTLAQTSSFPADANESGFNPAPSATQTRYLTASLSGISITAGSHIYLAWNISVSTAGTGNTSKAQALAIDDITIKAGPAAGPAPAFYFRTVTSGNWSSNTTWQFSSDNVNWTNPATRAPNYNDNTITILSGHTVTVSSLVQTDQTTVNGTVNVVAGGTLEVKDGIGFDITVNMGGVLSNNGGSIIIKSENTGLSSAGTASVGPSTGTISGNVTVERYISAMYPRSAWRLITAPLSTGTVSDKIWNNWQNNGALAAGIGTTVSGPDLPPATYGFDYTTPAYSMKTWNGTAFVPVTNTLTTPLFSANNIGYFTFIRGDRTTGIGGASSTVLSATGFLQVGNESFATSTTNNAFTLVPNPYASAVDLLTFSTDNSGSNTKSTYYYWDPYLTGMWGVGGYVTVSIDVNNNVTITPESGAQGDETRFLQSGQAMFVQTRATGQGGTPSVSFNENQKSYNVANNIFRTQGTQVDKIRVNLNVLSSGTPVLLDGIAADFNSAYNAALDDYDAHKLYNIGESISFMRNGTALSIERRPEITDNDIMNLNLTALKENITYQLEIKPSINAAGLNVYLVDNYLKTTTPIELSKATIVNFTINGEAASTGANRFYISFAKPVPVIAGKEGITIFPNPVTNGVINLQMNNMAHGVYNVRVFNSVGQVILNRSINHAAGNNTEKIYLGKGAIKGIYQLEVIKPDNSKFSSKVIAN